MTRTAQDLQHAREKATFPVQDMSVLIFGAAGFAARQKLVALLNNEPLFDPKQRVFMSRTDRYLNGISISKRLAELKREHNLSEEDFAILRSLTGENLATLIHDTVFLPALRTQASDEQLAKYLPLAEEYAIFGSYAQTELAHGSNVRGLQTTATYDSTTDEFIIHTPSIEAIKWWIGGLGKLATHAIVWARLIVKEKEYGVQPFMVQVRDLATHASLPGINVGDIGPKFGFSAVDNGYLQLNHVRIPRGDLLSRNTKVLRGGSVETKERALGYAGMLAVRAGMVRDSAINLARAVTIAVRYSAVRRQGNELNGQETLILDYNIQQYRLFPLLATTYALNFTGQWFGDLYKQLQAGDSTLLADVHAAASGLKSLCSTLAAEGMEVARKCCGGHGYSQFSGLPDLYSSYVHINTAEGDNVLMTQQTAKHIIKQLDAIRTGKTFNVSEQTKYLQKSETAIRTERCTAQKPDDLLNPAIQLQACEYQAAVQASRMYNHLQEERSRNASSSADPFQAVLIDAFTTSNAHCRMIIARNFIAGVEKVRATSPHLYAPLKRLSDLFVLHGLNLADLFENAYISSEQAGWIRDKILQLLKEIRVDAVALVDAWYLPDRTLASAIGKSDGHVYEALVDWAKSEPLNHHDVLPGAAATIQAMLRDGQSQIAKKSKL